MTETSTPENHAPDQTAARPVENDTVRIAAAMLVLCLRELDALDAVAKGNAANPSLVRPSGSPLGQMINNPVAFVCREGRRVLAQRLIEMLGLDMARAVEHRVMAEATRQAGRPLTGDMQTALTMLPRIADNPAEVGTDDATVH